MKQKNEKFIKIIEKNLSEDSSLICATVLKEIIEMLKGKEIDDNLEYEVLVELYKYIKLGNTITSVDPRGHRNIKFSALNNINNSIDKGNLTNENIESLKDVNKICLSYFLNPLKLVEEKEEFYKKYPNARF